MDNAHGLEIDKTGTAGNESLDMAFELIGIACGIEEFRLGLRSNQGEGLLCDPVQRGPAVPEHAVLAIAVCLLGVDRY